MRASAGMGAFEALFGSQKHWESDLIGCLRHGGIDAISKIPNRPCAVPQSDAAWPSSFELVQFPV